MSVWSKMRAARRAIENFGRNPRAAWVLPGFARGFAYGERRIPSAPQHAEDRRSHPTIPSTNPLWEFFSNRGEGRGIWKYDHYFDIYQRHFQRFVGSPVDVMEIGVYSGGSLDMWRAYFGDECRVYGVDIEPSCTMYARDGVSILIGDQADRSFWASVKSDVNGLDILIDDGGHKPEQQIVTLEEMLPHIRPGGVYVCEDIHRTGNTFAAFAAGLVTQLNATNGIPGDALGSTYPTAFQSAVHSIHFYPYVIVIEKHALPPSAFRSTKHGTEWNPAPYRE